MAPCSVLETGSKQLETCFSPSHTNDIDCGNLSRVLGGMVLVVTLLV